MSTSYDALGWFGLMLCVALALVFLWLGLRALAQRQDSSEVGGLSLHSIGHWLRVIKKRTPGDLRTLASHAGLYSREAFDLFLTLRLIALMAGALGALVMIVFIPNQHGSAKMAIGVTIAALSIYGPRYWLERRKAERHGFLAAALPRTIDLVVMCLEAGLNLEQALNRVISSETGSGRDEQLIQNEIGLVLDDVNVGVNVPDAFQRFADRTGSEEVRSVAAVIAKGWSLGVRLSGLLRNHADLVRNKLVMDLETSAGQANAKLSLPLSLCLLPAALIFIAGPALLFLIEDF